MGLQIHPGIAPECFLGESMSTYKYPKGFVKIPCEKSWGSCTELEFAPAYIDHVLPFINLNDYLGTLQNTETAPWNH